MLSVSHLTASYGVAQALFGVNFELADGEVGRDEKLFLSDRQQR